MHSKTLRELAKFASGLIFGDLIFGLWIYSKRYFPLTILGVNFNEQTVMAWLVFDILLLAYLLHYGWKTGKRPRTSSEKVFHTIAGIVFTIVALLHLSRILFGWNFMVGSWNAPYWVNSLGAIATAFLAYASFHLAHKK